MARGLQSKNSFNKSAKKSENFTAPNSPKNKAPKLATSIIKPFKKPLINPKPKAMARMISIVFTSANVLYFWESLSEINPKASIFEGAKKSKQR